MLGMTRLEAAQCRPTPSSFDSGFLRWCVRAGAFPLLRLRSGLAAARLGYRMTATGRSCELLVAPGTAIAAATAAARATIATLHFGAGLIDAEGAAAELAAVQGSNGAVSFGGV